MLEVDSISACYGAVRALEQTSLRIRQQEIVCLLGSNGAGKTTMLNCISGVLSLSAGHIRFEGHDLSSSSVDKIVAMGIVQVPEGREIFPNLSTADNLMLGAWTQRNRSNWRAQIEYVYDLFPRLLCKAFGASLAALPITACGRLRRLKFCTTRSAQCPCSRT